MVNKAQIQEHMEVLDCNGHCLGHVDHLVGDDQIRLNKAWPKGSGGEHVIPVAWISAVEGGRLRLDRSCDEAEQIWTPAQAV